MMRGSGIQASFGCMEFDRNWISTCWSQEFLVLGFWELFCSIELGGGLNFHSVVMFICRRFC